jgi:hypothetical protein
MINCYWGCGILPIKEKGKGKKTSKIEVFRGPKGEANGI